MFRVYRDCDSWRLRKVVLELWVEGELMDRRRMFGLFGSAFFKRRLKRKLVRMAHFHEAADSVVKSLTAPSH